MHVDALRVQRNQETDGASTSLEDEMRAIISGLQLSIACKDDTIAELQAALDNSNKLRSNSTSSLPSTPSETDQQAGAVVVSTRVMPHGTQEALDDCRRQNQTLRHRLATLCQEMETAGAKQAAQLAHVQVRCPPHTIPLGVHCRIRPSCVKHSNALKQQCSAVHRRAPLLHSFVWKTHG